MLEQFLLELALLFALCVLVAVSFHRLRLPPLVGFLVAGVIVGPNAVGLVHHEEVVRELAEVGIVVLLFAVGLEVPLQQLSRLRRAIAVGGGVQLLGTIALATAACLLLGLEVHHALFLAFLLTLSSTAAATKMLVDHGELGAPHGRTVLGIAVAQDLAVVPMIILIPLLAPGGGGDGDGSLLSVLANLGLLALLVVVANAVGNAALMPRLDHLGIAWTTSIVTSLQLLLLLPLAAELRWLVKRSALWASFARAAIAAGLMAGLLHFAGLRASAAASHEMLALTVLIGIASYALVLALLGGGELRELGRALRRRPADSAD